MRARRLAAEEHGAKIDVEHAVELGRILDSESVAIGDAGVIDQEIEPPQRVGRRVDGRSNGFQVADIQRNDVCPASEGLDLNGEFGQPALVAGGQRHVRSGLGQRQGDRPPDAAAGAGHKGAVAVKAKSFEDGHWCFRDRWLAQRSREGRSSRATLALSPLAGRCLRPSASRAARRVWRR